MPCNGKERYTQGVPSTAIRTIVWEGGLAGLEPATSGYPVFNSPIKISPATLLQR
jgi:hypothetical protein